MQCAKREPGRSWEAMDSELARLGLLPSTWPLPLSKDSISSALVPAAQGTAGPSSSAARQASPKRPTDSRHSSEASGKRSRSEIQTDSMASDEVALWSEALRLVNAALTKSGSAATLDEQIAVAKLRSEIQSKVQVPSVVPHPAVPLSLQPPAPQLVPVSMTGPDGQVQTAYTLQMQPSSQAQQTSQGFMETAGSMSLNPSQFLLSQPGVSAFQAVQPASPVYHGSQNAMLLNAPPLRLTSKPSLETSGLQPSSPSTDDEGNSANFNPSSLSGWSNGSPINRLFKPTAVKSDPATSSMMAPMESTAVPATASCPTGFPFMNLIAQFPGAMPPNFQSNAFSAANKVQAMMPGASTGAPTDAQTRQLPVPTWVPSLGASLQ